MIEKLPPPPRGTVDITINIPRQRRAELHFHLEASDGLGYLEEGETPDSGLIHTSSGQLEALLGWLEDAAGELELEIVAVERPSETANA